MKLDLAQARAKLKNLKLDPAALKKRFQNRSVVALTLGSSECAVRLVRRDSERIWPDKLVTLPRGADAIVSQPEAAGKELAALLAEQGIRERQCVVCVPPAWALTHSGDVPELAGEDLRGYLELRAEKEFPMAVSDLRLAHSTFTLPDGQRRVTLAAVPARRVAAIEQMLTVAGCKLVSLSLGLDHLVPRPGQPAKVHFLANGKHVDVVISAGGGIAGMRTLATTASPPEDAFDALGFCREVRITLGRLPDGLRQGVCEADFGGTPASADSLCEKTRAMLQKMGITSPSTSAPLGATRELNAIEAAERFLRERPASFEFVPPQVKKWEEWLQKVDSRRKRLLIGAGLGLIVLPALAFFVRSRIETSLAAEEQRMHNTVADLELVQGKIRRFRPWFEPAPQSLGAIEALVAAFPDSGETWAKSIQIHDGEAAPGGIASMRVSCTGYARSQTALSELIERVRSKPGVVELQRQQVRGEKPIQFSFTYRWEQKNAN